MANTERLPNHQDGINLKNAVDYLGSAIGQSTKIQQMLRVRWSDSSDEDIVELVNFCYDNDLNLHDDFGWDVGAPRMVNNVKCIVLDLNQDGDDKMYPLSASYNPGREGMYSRIIFAPMVGTDYPDKASTIYSNLKRFDCVRASRRQTYTSALIKALFCYNDLYYGSELRLSLTQVYYGDINNCSNGSSRRMRYFDSPNGDNSYISPNSYPGAFYNPNSDRGITTDKSYLPALNNNHRFLLRNESYTSGSSGTTYLNYAWLHHNNAGNNSHQIKNTFSDYGNVERYFMVL